MNANSTPSEGLSAPVADSGGESKDRGTGAAKAPQTGAQGADPRAVLLDTISTALNRAGFWLAIEGRRAIVEAVVAQQEREWVRAEIAAARAGELAATLDEALRQFVHKGHPGEPCLQAGWISERTVQRWRDTCYRPKEKP